MRIDLSDVKDDEVVALVHSYDAEEEELNFDEKISDIFWFFLSMPDTYLKTKSFPRPLRSSHQDR